MGAQGGSLGAWGGSLAHGVVAWARGGCSLVAAVPHLAPLGAEAHVRGLEQRLEGVHLGLALRRALGLLLALEGECVLLVELLALELVAQTEPARVVAEELQHLGTAQRGVGGA